MSGHRFLIFLAAAGLLAWRATTAQPTGCTEIYPPSAGWAIDLCTGDPSFPERMEVILDGASRGIAAMVRVSHDTDDQSARPQVAVFNASGFVRLKPNADPAPPIPFGSSFVLGPAYWSDATSYHHNPEIATLDLDTSLLPAGPLRLTAAGANEDFDVTWEMALPPPVDRQTRLHVVQRYTATDNITVDPARVASAEGFKLVQISSMFINLGTGCDGGNSDCHDSDGVRYLGADGERRQVALDSLAPSAFVFAATEPLGSTWLDALHADDASWQGNTPNVRIALDVQPARTGPTVTPQGWIEATNDPNDDNVGLWLHDDDPAAHFWTPISTGEISYWLLAQDDPPEPWSDLGLRPGATLLDMEGGENCFFAYEPGQGVSGSVAAIAGYNDRSLELAYDLGTADGNWAQLRCDFDPPLDLSAYDHLRFDWRGDIAAANSLDVALISRTAGEDLTFPSHFHHASHRPWWGQLIVPFASLGPGLNPAAVVAFYVSVVKDPKGDDDDGASAIDDGGAGALAIDNVAAFDLSGRAVPADFETVPATATASSRAAAWLSGQQQATGLLRSWEQQPGCVAHIYDQALALLVFADAELWAEADAVVAALAAHQNASGSWFRTRDCLTLLPLTTDEWVGDTAWAIFALNRYLDLGGGHGAAASARDRAISWLLGRLDASSGCPLLDHTEAAIDTWWALVTAESAHECAAAGVRECLLRDYWDPLMGRFKGGRDRWQPYLDNQTWGGALLRAIGESGDAIRALDYAREVLSLPAQGGQLHGLDGQGGPWSVLNEGVAQYAAAGGEGAAELARELLAQQRSDGAMPGSPDDFEGGGVWTTRWYGVAPTAWLYQALSGGPFPNFVPPGPDHYRLNLFGTIDDRQSFVACESVHAGPDLHLDPGADVTLDARRVIFNAEVSLAAGARLEVVNGSG